MGLLTGAVFHHGGVPENCPLALLGRFPSLTGRFPTLMGRFPECLNAAPAEGQQQQLKTTSDVTSKFHLSCRVSVL